LQRWAFGKLWDPSVLPEKRVLLPAGNWQNIKTLRKENKEKKGNPLLIQDGKVSNNPNVLLHSTPVSKITESLICFSTRKMTNDLTLDSVTLS
jgi:hypothetical protein